MDRAGGGRRPCGRGHLARPPGAALRARGQPRAPGDARGLDALVPAGGALRRGGPAAARAARPGARGHAPDGRLAARERRRAAARPRAARLPRLRRGRAGARHGGQRGHPRPRTVRPRHRPGEPRDVPAVRARRDRVEPPGRRLRRDRPRLDGRARAGRRPPRARRPRDGGPERAPLPGLARGVPADRPPRPLLVLRGVHPHHRLDVQPAREVAEGHARDPVAAADRVAQLPAHVARLAPGPQRLLPPGPGLHRPRGQQEVRDHPRLPAAGRQLPALRRRPLPAQPPLRERDRRRQAAVARLALDGRGRGPLHPRPRHLVLGGQRGAGRRARRRARLRRRRADAGDRRRGGDPARPAARAAHPRRERRRPDAPPGRRGASARDARRRVRRALHRGQAGDLRLPRLSVADPPAHLPALEPRQPARARLQGGGHDHDALRHADAQRHATATTW